MLVDNTIKSQFSRATLHTHVALRHPLVLKLRWSSLMVQEITNANVSPKSDLLA